LIIVNRIVLSKDGGSGFQFPVGFFEEKPEAEEFFRQASEKFEAVAGAGIAVPSPEGPRLLPFTVGQYLEELGVRFGHRIWGATPAGKVLVPQAPKIVLATR
jgi:hypothetical protein